MEKGEMATKRYNEATDIVTMGALQEACDE